ncbi:hypothetical protein Tco_0954757 [Tanacetum coccineum]|uniref:Uncharacterized protein n=1 Tax=Tanacetum coccineum TaxID=301880 RepID=A0ABQ5E5B2_9ASTR
MKSLPVKAREKPLRYESTLGNDSSPIIISGSDLGLAKESTQLPQYLQRNDEDVSEEITNLGGNWDGSFDALLLVFHGKEVGQEEERLDPRRYDQHFNESTV